MARPSRIKEIERQSFTRRAVLIGAVGFAGMAALTSRLYYLQFVRAEKYRILAEDNRIRLQIIAPSRGKILDRNGEILAENESVFRLFIDRERYPDLDATLDTLKQWITFSERDEARLKRRLARRGYERSTLLKDDLPWEEVVRIEYHLPDLPGIRIEQGQQRLYPLSEQAAHMLGYIAPVTKEQQKEFYRWSEAKAGKQGLEIALEDRLCGRPGLRQLEVNSRGLVLRKVEETPSQAGEDVTTTIHRELQAYTYNKLLEKLSGAAVVMDANDGSLLALASAPSFDSTQMSQGIDQKNWDALRLSDKSPLLDKSIAGMYPPGSTFKMMTGLAGLEHGYITPAQKVHCPGHYFVGSQRFNCWKEHGHGWMNLESAIAQSCDTYFYHIAHQMPMEKLARTCQKFGIGQKTGIDIPGEKDALLPDEQWKYRQLGERWQTGDTVNASIGQGYVLMTPLQLAVMTASLVNGGKRIRPRLHQPSEMEAIDVQAEHLALLKQSMNNVVNGTRGTARGSAIYLPDYKMGGKTGTAQVRKITERGQNQDEVPWKFRHHALFVGYAPIDVPRYVCAVVIEHGGGGSSAAAPVARDLLLKTREMMET